VFVEVDASLGRGFGRICVSRTELAGELVVLVESKGSCQLLLLPQAFVIHNLSAIEDALMP
jgi:hypothetical protein